MERNRMKAKIAQRIFISGQMSGNYVWKNYDNKTKINKANAIHFNGKARKRHFFFR